MQQKALSWVTNLEAWQLLLLLPQVMVILVLVRISLPVTKLSRMKFWEIPHHSWPGDGMPFLQSR